MILYNSEIYMFEGTYERQSHELEVYTYRKNTYKGPEALANNGSHCFCEVVLSVTPSGTFVAVKAASDNYTYEEANWGNYKSLHLIGTDNNIKEIYEAFVNTGMPIDAETFANQQ